MEKINITIVGAGVVGLAIARELAGDYQDIFVVERNSSFGQETSSRNSEVIHAGIYYPRDSFKAKTCVRGRDLLYNFCAKYNIAHKKIGKCIVAIDSSEIPDLEKLLKQGLENGVSDLRFISKSELKALEPNVQAEAAIYSPSTGILDTHSFMKELDRQFEASGGAIAYNTEVIAIDKTKEGFTITVRDKIEGEFKFSTRLLINAAGLNSDKVAGLVGIESLEYKLKYCKGDYFRAHNNKGRFINRLIYPAPKERGSGLGIHATLDLAASLRLGPDDEYVENINYEIDPAKAKLFYESVKFFLPFIRQEDLSVDTAGIRPKLQGEAEGFRDFIIKDERDNGFAGLINLIGIESPGLTSSLAIAKIIKKIVKNV